MKNFLKDFVDVQKYKLKDLKTRVSDLETKKKR